MVKKVCKKNLLMIIHCLKVYTYNNIDIVDRDNDCDNWIPSSIIIPYSGKFSRVSIFADAGFRSFSRFNFQGSRVHSHNALLHYMR